MRRNTLPAMFGESFDLRIEIDDIGPPIWRRMRVAADLLLCDLHQALQIAFGWSDSHLHEFHVGHVVFGITGVSEDMFCVDERFAPLGALVRRGGTFSYVYDFGDNWNHSIHVESIVSDPEGPLVTCLDGGRACPPDDCGGVSGYEQLLSVLSNPKHEEYSSMKRWVGRRFDPERFDLAAVSKKLAALQKRLLKGR